MIFSWLVPVILLSADTGRFVSRSVCLHLHRKLEHRLNAKQGPRSGRMLANRVMSQVGGWGGAAYTYRPEKPLFATGPYDRSPRHLFLIAASFVFLACAAGFTICYLTPKVGLNCRPLSILAFGFLWLLSVFTSWSASRRGCKAKTHFWVM